VLLTELKMWKKAYRMKNDDEEEEGGRTMTPWESLLWTTWMPKVRSAMK
jgi:tuftelin-interacting protein 11